MTDRLETSADAASDLSSRARRVAREGDLSSLARRAARDGADEARSRADDAVERAADALCERLVGRSVDEVRERSLEGRCGRPGVGPPPGSSVGSSADSDGNPERDPIDRALEAFLRRYDLDETRLDEDTLASIRDRLAADLEVEVELADILERLGDDSPDSDGDSAGGPASTSDEPPTRSVDEALEAVCSRLRSDLEIDPNRSLRGAVEDVLERDAVVVGHAVERALTEELPDLIRASAREAALERMDAFETAEPRLEGATDDAKRGTADENATGALGLETADVDPSGAISGALDGSVREVAASAIAATTLLSDDATAGRPLADAFPLLASVLLGNGGANGGIGTGDGIGGAGGSDGPRLLMRALLEVADVLLFETDVGGVGPDLSALRARSTGAKALVGLFVANLVAMSVGAWLSRERAPPIPDEIRGPNGETVVTAERVRMGKKAFQANGLMNHGSVLGNGSYFGVDLTADALEMKAEFMRDYYARERGAESFEALEAGDRAVVAERVERELDSEAELGESGADGSIAAYSAAEVYAHRRIRDRYVDRYYGGSPERGIPQGYLESPEQAERVADFACWTAWMAHTRRPGSDHSYTNDWPYVPGTGNRSTGQVVVWSTISLVLLVAGGGAGVWAYHAFDFAEPTTEVVDVPAPDEVSITPSQYVAAWYVPVAGALFVSQALVGALLAHYYVERTGFYGIGEALGIDVVELLPFSIGRTWHVNLGVLWITTLWLAGGLFLPGLFTDSDPPWQARGASVLLGALVVATVGAFAGIWLGVQGKLGTPEGGDLWWWLGSEGLEYLETGRLWKLSLLGALAGWTGLVLRSVRQLDEPPTGLGHFMTYAGGSIALMFGASMLYTPETNIAVTEFWRWWVVHMWVEGVFEFFVTAVISVALVSMELVEQSDAETAILFEVFTIMAAGIVGVSHHYWWVGLPDFWVPIGTTFSTLEFVPLVFLLYRGLGEYRSLSAQEEAFPYALPLLFIIGSSVWNFVGGGVLGFFINLPVINYYEHGTYLTVAHAHTATFGAFGLLALGLGTYVLRVVTPEEDWEPRWFEAAFWLTNVGLVVMTVASLLPIGFAQLQTAYQDGYAAARSLEFYERDDVQTMLWARTLGDTPMILGALAFTVGAVRHLFASRRRVAATSDEGVGWLRTARRAAAG